MFCGYTWSRWFELSRLERAAGVAHYRVHHLVELHGEDAVSREADRRAKQER